ncbi:MAG TPA: hypothetical protein VGH42_01345, partial [Verrucomicrobiae bacterium]
MTITVNPISGDLWQPTISVNGTVSDPSYSVWVNGVEATVDGGGNWGADNVPITDGGTACFDVVANGSSSVTQSLEIDKPPTVIVNQYSDQWTDIETYSDGSHFSVGASKNYTMT